MSETKGIKFENNTDPDEAAHNELDSHCLQSSMVIPQYANVEVF